MWLSKKQNKNKTKTFEEVSKLSLNQYFFIQSVILKNNSKAKNTPKTTQVSPSSPEIIIRTKIKRMMKLVNRFIQEW